MSLEGLSTKIDQLTKIILDPRTPHQDEAQNLIGLIKEESNKNARRFARLEARITFLESRYELHGSPPQIKKEIIPYKGQQNSGPQATSSPGISNPSYYCPGDKNRPGSITKPTKFLGLSTTIDQVPRSSERRPKRTFTNLDLSYTEAAELLFSKNLIQPIGPTVDLPANDRSKGWNKNEYCLYHRGRGHTTEKCFCLKHKIQDLIDAGSLSDPKTWLTTNADEHQPPPQARRNEEEEAHQSPQETP